jgi:hypothetical protein
MTVSYRHFEQPIRPVFKAQAVGQLTTGPIGCSKTSAINYHCRLLKLPKTAYTFFVLCLPLLKTHCHYERASGDRVMPAEHSANTVSLHDSRKVRTLSLYMPAEHSAYTVSLHASRTQYVHCLFTRQQNTVRTLSLYLR